jgi:hypothetical protein
MTDLLPIKLDPRSAPGKTKYVDQDGDSVRVYDTDGGGDLPIIGAYWDTGLEWWVNCRFPADGTGLRLRPQPAPQPREWWINEYPFDVRVLFATRKEADAASPERRIACIHVREVLEDDDD